MTETLLCIRCRKPARYLYERNEPGQANDRVTMCEKHEPEDREHYVQIKLLGQPE